MPSKADGPLIYSSRARSSSPEDFEELVYNPFDDRDGHQYASTSSKPFTSAIASSSSRSSLRRRGSDGALSSKGVVLESTTRTGHSRSRTADGAHHPLSRATSPSSSTSSRRQSAGNTRPGLARLLTSWSIGTSSSVRSTSNSERKTRRAESREDSSDDDIRNKSTVRTEEKVVLVHEVAPKDSLAGVALKYGISIAELRRANQLWTSDSIHLRKVLYIPVEQARLAKAKLALDSTVSGPSQPPSTSLDQAYEPNGGAGVASDTFRHDPEVSVDPDLQTSPYVIRRIPATQLSYFPPSHTDAHTQRSHPSAIHTQSPARSDSSPASDRRLADYFSGGPRPGHTHRRAHTLSTATGSMPNLPTLRAPVRTLSSLFSALPKSAATRDGLFSRLSIDSASTSTSNTGSDEFEHELATVPTTPKSRTILSTASPIPFVSRGRPLNGSTQTSPSSLPSLSLLSRTPSFGQRNGNRSPTKQPPELIPLSSNGIHTTQMQPAPTMELPPLISKTPSKGSSNSNGAIGPLPPGIVVQGRLGQG